MAGDTRPKIVVVGVALLQLRFRVPKLPEPGGDVLASSLQVGLGGSGINVARALSSLGAPIEFVLRRGDGPLDRLAQAELGRLGISVRGEWSDAPSGVTIALVEPSGERSFVSAAGAEGQVGARDLLCADLGHAGFLYVSGYELLSSPDLEETVANLPRRIEVLLDPGPRGASPGSLGRAWRRADLVRMNADEAQARSGTADAKSAAALLSREGPPVVVSTSSGAYLGTQGRALEIAGGEPVTGDTTGAGDAHAAGILAARCSGLSLADAVAAGNRVARASVAGEAFGPGILQALGGGANGLD
ncbi:MAG: PfkB family carbohydrate kinase [Thermaerobacter sp.]|nr:PfkB family carbohydrate kinase [Thermaerobacter sp.]